MVRNVIRDWSKFVQLCPQGRVGMGNFINVKQAVLFQDSSIFIE